MEQPAAKKPRQAILLSFFNHSTHSTDSGVATMTSCQVTEVSQPSEPTVLSVPEVSVNLISEDLHNNY